MASYSASDLVTALTGEIPGFRESELLTSRDLLKKIYNPTETGDELMARILNPLKDELLNSAAVKRSLIGGTPKSGSYGYL